MAAHLRENSQVPTEGWSDWKRAMVPPQTKGRNLKPRGQNQVGFISSSIRDAFSAEAEHCGIYEWQEDLINLIVSFMLEAHAGARKEH